MNNYAEAVVRLRDRIADLKRVMDQMDEFGLDKSQAEELLAEMEGALEEYQAIIND